MSISIALSDPEGETGVDQFFRRISICTFVPFDLERPIRHDNMRGEEAYILGSMPPQAKGADIIACKLLGAVHYISPHYSNQILHGYQTKRAESF